jgi:hypothetical protein
MNICGDCLRYGCPWEARFEPVPGWEATRTKVDPNGTYRGLKKGYESYDIKKCPLFIDGTKRKDASFKAAVALCRKVGLKEKPAPYPPQKPLRQPPEPEKRKVLFCRDLKTREITSYSSVYEAAAAEGRTFTKQGISDCIWGRSQMHRDCVFWWEGSPEPEVKHKSTGRKPKPICGTHQETGQVVHYPSCKAAAEQNPGWWTDTLCSAANKGKKVYGYIWQWEGKT